MADFCLRCGRALKNKASVKRGYGPGCAKKLEIENMKDNTEQAKEFEEIEGQIFIDELKSREIA